MEKAMVREYLIGKYNQLDFTKGHYIVGTHERGVVYVHILDNFHFVEMSYVDKASKGAGYCLKYRQTKKTVEALRARATYSFPLCTEEHLVEVAKTYSKKQTNRGKAFEKLVTEYFGGVWEDDHVPFWEDGDITIDGQAYQIKYDNCNFCNEKQMALREMA